MESNLCGDRLDDNEIEYLIRKRTWNPRWTRPHFPWNSDTPPAGIINGL
jgi:hypothetical protein